MTTLVGEETRLHEGARSAEDEALGSIGREKQGVGMRAIVEGKLYDTETAELIHSTGFEGSCDMPKGGYSQSLYLSPNGTFFYVSTFPHSKPAFYVIGGKLDTSRSIARISGEEWDEVRGAIQWLENHGGSEVILERWPERVWAG